MNPTGSLGDESAAMITEVIEEESEGDQSHCRKEDDSDRPKVVRVERLDLQRQTEGRVQGEGAFPKIAEGAEDV
jgi:hypothetical protein